MRSLGRLLLIAAACGQGCASPATGAGTPTVATFQCDVTPPIGHPLCGGLRQAADAVADPLAAKGIILDDGRTRVVLCAVDWCRIQNESHELFRAKLAAAAETDPSHVAVQTTHAHETPMVDSVAQRLMDAVASPPRHTDLAFLEQATDRVAAAARAARSTRRPFTHVGFGKGRVNQVASNSRVRLADGKLVERPSVTTSTAIQAQPEGLIDPWIRTVTLFNGDAPLVRLHYFACHPENSKTDGKVSSDVFGPLRERLEKAQGIPHVYFAGCGGNVGMGKYHVSPAEACKARAIDRICDGIREAERATRRAPVARVDWKIAEARLVPRSEKESEADLRERLADASRPEKARIGAALSLSWMDRVRKRPTIDITVLRLGPVSIVHLPGEPFVEYQLFAQSRTGDFVAVAGYGDGGPGYICTDEGYAEGGYQPSASRVVAPTESRLREAIAAVLD